MKTLIVYYSLTGNNELLANEIQKYLDCDAIRIRDRKPRTVLTFFKEMFLSGSALIDYPVINLNNYEHVLLIAPVWSGKVASPITTFLKKERRMIKKYSFISVCGGREGQQARLRKQLTTILPVAPSRVIELWISKLIKEEGVHVAGQVSRYHVKRSDIKSFEPVLEPFLKTLAPEEEEAPV